MESMFIFTFLYWLWPLTLSLMPFLSPLSLCHHYNFVISNLLSLFSLFLLHTISSLLMKTCYFVVSLSLSTSTLSFFFFPSFPTSPPSSCLLQVVKWILLSQSHQGKSRKRKRKEPKVNYKEVGDALVYYDFYLHCFFFYLNSWRCTFSILETSVFLSIWVFALVKLLWMFLIVWQQNYPQFCLCVVSVRIDYLVLVQVCVYVVSSAHIFNLLRACIHHIPSTVSVCVSW